MFELHLAETREYSPHLLEHWLHTLQKQKSGFQFCFKEKEGKVRLLCSEDLSPFLPGSRAKALRSENHPNPQKPLFLHQRKGPLLPIKRFSQFEDRVQKTHISPLDTFIKTLAKTPDGSLTLNFRPLPERKRERALKKAKKPHFEPERHFDQWESRGWFCLSLRRLLGPLVRKLLQNLRLPNRNPKPPQEQTQSLHEREDPRQAILDKLARPLFKGTLVSSHPFRAYVDGFSLPYLGQLSLRRKNSRVILSAEELATLLSLPNAKENATYLYTEPSAYLPPPRGPSLHLEEEDRKRHLYVLGKTGMGKSTALLHFFQEDARKERAVVMLDPHGDLITEALKVLPEEKYRDVLFLDPSRLDYPLALNPVECQDGENANLKTSALVEMFERLAQGSWGPRLEYILRNALLLLTLAPNTTLLDLPRILTSKNQAQKLLRFTKDLELHRFFEEEFFAQDERSRQEHIAPILNKVGPLLLNPLLRNIFAQPKSKFSFEDAFKKRKLILISLSKGKLGEDASQLLGMIFISMIQSALFRRAQVDAKEREMVSVYLDEFQNFCTPTLLGMLSESRKYGLAMILANQYLTQVPPEIQDAVLGNVGSLLCFRSSYQDAEVLAPSLGLIEEDMVALAPFQAYAKFLQNQKPLPLFRFELEPPSTLNPSSDLLEKLKQSCAERYGRRLSLVEEKIQKRYNRKK